ncbi:MAG: NAD(P)H-dependent oxidoreductase subunit E [Deltaproteobacteria bacterium]|nr:NAD(P)H-dependent oxidoreductase subunit E [Deltaproteobacteria bacterium]
MSNISLTDILKEFRDPARDSLIPILQREQQQRGFISKEAMIVIGEKLNLPVSKVYGVASFYNQFRFNAPGLHQIQVCRGTACHVKGSSTVLDSLEMDVGCKSGETSKDGLFSIEVVACVGACSLAPVVVVDGEFHAGMDSTKMRKINKTLRKVHNAER